MSIPFVSVLSPQDKEKRSIDDFLEHLRNILSNMCELPRMDLQGEIIALVHQRNQAFWLRNQPASSLYPCFPHLQNAFNPFYQTVWQQFQDSFGANDFSRASKNNVDLSELTRQFIEQSILHLDIPK